VGNIGKPIRRVTLVPAEEPGTIPEKIPQTTPATEPAKTAPEREKVPA
jgi:hypothetical protein